jgi:hypothetical protein
LLASIRFFAEKFCHRVLSAHFVNPMIISEMPRCIAARITPAKVRPEKQTPPEGGVCRQKAATL